MAYWENGAEGGDNGTAVTAANSGTSGDAFTLVSNTSGGTVTYSTAQAAIGNKSYNFVAPTNGSTLVRWAQTSPTQRFRAYIRIAAIPTGSVVIAQLRANTTGTGSDLRINSSGVLLTATSQALCTLSINTWYMVSIMVTRGTTTSNGYIKAEVRNVSGSTVLGSYESSTQNTGIEDLTYVQFGKLVGANPDINIFFDQVAFDVGSGSLIGPYTSSTPDLSISHDTYHVVDATGSVSGAGGALTYTAAWVSGPTLTYTQPQTGIFYFTQNTSGPSAYTITVSEAGGSTDSLEITVPAGVVGTQTINNSAPLYPVGSVPGSTWG